MGVARTMVIGAVVVALFFGGFGVWAGFAPLESAAIAQGDLSVSGERKAVQHLEGGIVNEIRVREGDFVQAGQTVVVLDETRTRAKFAQLLGQFRSAAALKARLEAERDGLEEVRYPEWLNRAVATEGADDFTATQDRIFRARARSLENRVAIYRKRIAQMREESAGLQEENAAKDRQIALLADEVDSMRALVEKGYEGKSRMYVLERRKAETEGDRANNRARIARVGQRIGETRLAMVELANGNLTAVVAELRDVESRMSDLRESLSAARAELARTRVTAPVAGTVVNLRVFTRGGVVRAGQTLMEIVPVDEDLVIVARIAPTDIDSVYPDLPAQARLTAFSHLTTPILSATVQQVSADILADERTGIPYYEARVTLDPGQPELRNLKLQPGMPVEVMIITGKRTALDYLLKPIVASFGRALREQ